MNSLEVVKYLLENNFLMTVATADNSGKPWVSPVGFAYDEKFNLYWVSAKNAIHSENIRNNPRVAISIVGQVPPNYVYDGAYFDAEAKELTDSTEIERAIVVRSKREKRPDFMIHGIDQVTGAAAARFYMATPKSIYKRADAKDEKSGQSITVREQVEF